MSTPDRSPLPLGSEVVVEVGSVAHGGHCVARHDGRVIFVRHCLPGEKVRARITEAPAHGRFARADVIEVLTASPDRVPAPCRYAGDCGGCDWQHASLPAQRALKAAVIAEQFRRLAGLKVEPVVEAVPGDDGGLGWRTRVRFSVDPDGRAGLRRSRSHQVVPIDTCLLAHAGIRGLGVTGRTWAGSSEVLAVAPSIGAAVALPDPRPGQARVGERAADREWRLDATAFWQVHPGAADALVGAVRTMLQPRAGDHVIDLYSGAGLFAGALAEDLGVGGRIDAVDSDAVAVRSARRSLHDLPTIHLHEQQVDAWLRSTSLRRCDLVVLDPPRSGAGRGILQRTLRLRPRAVAYVACDPASLARDVATARDLGWELSALRALDLFPMTQHVECIALLTPATVEP